MQYLPIPKFLRKLRKLPLNIQEDARIAIKLFVLNHNDPKLDLHKLKNLFEPKWAFSVNYDLRIIVASLSNPPAIFVDIITHDEYSRLRS